MRAQAHARLLPYRHGSRPRDPTGVQHGYIEPACGRSYGALCTRAGKESNGTALLRSAGPQGFIPPKVDRRSVLEADEVSSPVSVANDFRHAVRLSHRLPARV